MKMPLPPKASRSLIVRLAAEHWSRSGPGGPLPDRYIVSVRGYRATTMGPTPGNDPNQWDDAWFWVTPEGMHAINANTDPTRYGWNAGVGKPMAVLNPGVWAFRRGAHKGRTPALRQMTAAEAKKWDVPNDGRFAVTRTYAPGDPRNYQESGYYAINMHDNYGSDRSTTSEGCLTAHSKPYRPWMQRVWDESEAAGMNVIWNILIDGPII